jgi:hypothetical protein
MTIVYTVELILLLLHHLPPNPKRTQRKQKPHKEQASAGRSLKLLRVKRNPKTKTERTWLMETQALRSKMTDLAE